MGIQPVGVQPGGAIGPSAMGSAGELPVMWEAPAFSLTNQEGKAFSSEDLKGEPYIADFIYTSCPGQCPVMTATLSRLQAKLPAGLRIVSFSVDPDHDTPAVLAAYAKVARADTGRWNFLTGPKSAIFNEGVGMKIVAPNVPIDLLTHDSHFFLVDSIGRVRLICSSSNPAEVENLVASAKDLCDRGGE